jgi:glycosyltransferase involved in cell wall biosynthesis
MLGERRDVARILMAADAFLLTSLSEGIPVTVIEAMGASLPVVATDVGGVSEVVATGETGLLVPAGAHEKLADAIVQLIDHRELRTTMGEAGRQRAESLFTEEQMHAAYAALYRRMMNWKTMQLPGKVDHERGIAGPAGIR